MIHLTKLNGAPFIVNADLIEQLEVTPDTVIILTTGTILVVRESVEEVVGRAIEYRRQTAAAPVSPGIRSTPDGA